MYFAKSALQSLAMILLVIGYPSVLAARLGPTEFEGLGSQFTSRVLLETAPIADQCLLHSNQYRNVLTSGVQDGTPFKSNVCAGGDTVGYENGAGTDVTVSVGADLGLDFGKIWSAGVSAEVSYTASTSSAGMAQATCPVGAWTCALVVIPKIHVISGEVRSQAIQSDCPEAEWQPFQINAPDVDPNNVATLGIDMCTCQNKVGWADPGHIAYLCPWDC